MPIADKIKRPRYRRGFFVIESFCNIRSFVQSNPVFSIMRKKYSLLLILCIGLEAMKSHAQLTLTFPSRDSVQVTADWYPVEIDMPVILLCHQNRFSRGEYKETAVKLNTFGFNCLAIDQRVGDTVNGVPNETAARAKAKKLQPVYADTEKDILAALDFLYVKYNKKIILMGSSYSASLVLKIAATDNRVLAVIAFSPGEYFPDKKFVAKSISGLRKPVFT